MSRRGKGVEDMRHIGILGVLLTGALALAQSAPPPLASAALPAPALEKPSNVPDAEKLQRSNQAVTGMREVLRDVLTKLEEARRTQDVVKLNCVNEKLTQLKGLLRISEQSDVALQESVARHEVTASEHEYTKVMIAQQKVAQLRTEAEQCIGQLAFRTDGTLAVEVEEPKDLPGGDPSRDPPPDVVIIRPPAASAIR